MTVGDGKPLWRKWPSHGEGSSGQSTAQSLFPIQGKFENLIQSQQQGDSKGICVAGILQKITKFLPFLESPTSAILAALFAKKQAKQNENKNKDRYASTTVKRT